MAILIWYRTLTNLILDRHDGPDHIGVKQKRTKRVKVRFNCLTSFSGESDMTLTKFAIVPAMVLILGAATALAQPATHPFVQFNQAVAGAANAAYIGGGSNPNYLRNQHLLTQEPGYFIGTGAAQVSGF